MSRAEDWAKEYGNRPTLKWTLTITEGKGRKKKTKREVVEMAFIKDDGGLRIETPAGRRMSVFYTGAAVLSKEQALALAAWIHKMYS